MPPAPIRPTSPRPTRSIVRGCACCLRARAPMLASRARTVRSARGSSIGPVRGAWRWPECCRATSTCCSCSSSARSPCARPAASITTSSTRTSTPASRARRTVLWQAAASRCPRPGRFSSASPSSVSSSWCSFAPSRRRSRSSRCCWSRPTPS